MADPPETGGTGAAPGPESTSRGVPRWVKVFVIVAAVVVLALVVLFVASGGQHGPSRHLPGTNGSQTTPAGGHTPPPGHTPFVEHSPAP
jgi:hypothetical protein